MAQRSDFGLACANSWSEAALTPPPVRPTPSGELTFSTANCRPLVPGTGLGAPSAESSKVVNPGRARQSEPNRLASVLVHRESSFGLTCTTHLHTAGPVADSRDLHRQVDVHRCRTHVADPHARRRTGELERALVTGLHERTIHACKDGMEHRVPAAGQPLIAKGGKKTPLQRPQVMRREVLMRAHGQWVNRRAAPSPRKDLMTRCTRHGRSPPHRTPPRQRPRAGASDRPRGGPVASPRAGSPGCRRSSSEWGSRENAWKEVVVVAH